MDVVQGLGFSLGLSVLGKGLVYRDTAAHDEPVTAHPVIPYIELGFTSGFRLGFSLP